MTILTESTGAQVLPNIYDPRCTTSGWSAHLAADADMRTKHPEYAKLAGTLWLVKQ